MITRIQNNTTQTSFKRKFKNPEMTGLLRGNIRQAIDLGIRIGRGEITSKDGARAQLNDFTRAQKKVKDKGFQLGKEIYYGMDDLDKGRFGLMSLASSGFLQHEIQGMATKSPSPIVTAAIKIGKGLVKPEGALEQIHSYEAEHGSNVVLGFFKEQLEKMVAPAKDAPKKPFAGVLTTLKNRWNAFRA